MEPPRGMIETNEIPQNNFDGYFQEEEFLVEEEDPSYLEPAYSGELSYVVEPTQHAYKDPLGNYQPTRPPYMSSEVDDSLEAENDSEKEMTSDEVMDEFDNLKNNLAHINAPSQIVLPTNKKLTPKPLQPISLEYDSGEPMLDNRLRSRGYNKPAFRQDSKSKPGKDLKSVLEEPIEKKPTQKELFTRTTTITKTTTWYVDENNDMVTNEEIDERPSPIKGKYSKKSKTTTSGPIPRYLQDFEEVIFEEENEKRKTILEKMSLLKGLNPTSITSFTTAPNPWSSEVHEEVVFEEFLSAKENIDADFRLQKAHAFPMEQVVEYLPRPKTIFEEIEEIEEELLEELVEMLEEEGEVVVEIIIADFPPFAPIPMPQIQFPYPQFQPPIHPLMKPQTAPPQLAVATTPQPTQPLQTPAPTTPEVGETKIEEEPKAFSDTSYPNPNEMMNGHSANQVTTPKPMTTMPPLIENNFTQYPPVGPIPGPEQMYTPQPNYNIPQPTQMPQLYGNMQTQQPNQNYPGRRDFNGQLQQQKEEQNRYQQRMEAEGKMKMVPPGPPGKQRQMYPGPQQQGMNRQQPRGRDL